MIRILPLFIILFYLSIFSRDPDREYGASSLFVLQAYSPMVGLGKPLGYGQPQAGTSCCRPWQPVKLFKHFIQRVLRKPRTIVLYQKLKSFCCGFYAYSYMGARGRMLKGIVQEVVEDLLEQRSIYLKKRELLLF